MSLRDYQQRAIDELGDELRRGYHSVVLTCPTGSGKTHIAIAIIHRALAKGKRIMFVCDRIELIDQTSRRFDEYGIPHGIIQADNERYNPGAPVQICSIQTLTRRVYIEPPDLCIIDESHCIHKTQVEMINDWNDVRFIGMTATPFTKGMGKIYEKNVVVETTASLINKGHLCKYIAYGPAAPDLKGIRTQAGDYNQKQLGKRVNKKTILGQVVKTWLAKGGDRQTICFAVDIAHSKAIVDEFVANGVDAAHIDAYTNPMERKKTIDGFKAGDIRLVSSVDILTKGFDYPEASCLIMARPTKSLIVHIQQCGRVLRVAPGKDNAILLDHGGNVARLGFPTDELPTVLCNGERNNSEAKPAESLPKPCPKCEFIKKPGIHTCPQCGFAPEKATHVVFKDCELKKIEKVSMDDKSTWYAMLLHYARSKGHKDGWAAHKYREKFGVWPARKTGIHPTPPNSEVTGWITHLYIKHAAETKKATDLPKSCKYCGSRSLEKAAGTGPHAGQLKCHTCGHHLQWISRDMMKLHGAGA